MERSVSEGRASLCIRGYISFLVIVCCDVLAFYADTSQYLGAGLQSRWYFVSSYSRMWQLRSGSCRKHKVSRDSTLCSLFTIAWISLHRDGTSQRGM